jgi:hypothetical protein
LQSAQEHSIYKNLAKECKALETDCTTDELLVGVISQTFAKAKASWKQGPSKFEKALHKLIALKGRLDAIESDAEALIKLKQEADKRE